MMWVAEKALRLGRNSIPIKPVHEAAAILGRAVRHRKIRCH